MSRAWFLVLFGAGLIAAGEPVLVQGRVTSAADGRPLKGATVTVRDWYDVVGWQGVDVDAPAPSRVIETDANGAFVVPAAGLEGPVITVAAPGHASVTWRTDESAPAGSAPRRDVALPRAAAFEGRVLGSDGAPVPLAQVYAVEWDALDLDEIPDPLAAAADLLWGSEQHDRDVAYRYVTAAADEEGVFRIADADATKAYAVVAASPDRGPGIVPRPLVPGGLASELRLDPASPLRVRVVTEDGRPLAVNEAELRGSPRRTQWTVVGEGTYVLTPVAPGSHILVLKTETSGEVRHEFTVARGVPRHEVEVRVAAGNTVSGLVLDADGSPVVGARVNVQAWDPVASESRSCNVYTDEEGRFTTRGQPEGQVRIYVIAAGFQTAHLTDLAHPIPALKVRLRRARDVTLEVLPPEGLPMPGHLAVAARALGEEGGAGGEWITDSFVSWEAGEPVTIAGVPIGRSAIRLWIPGSALFERVVEIPAGKPGEPVPLDPVQLQPAQTVTVRLVDENGRPLPGLKVHAIVDDLPPVAWTEIQKTTGTDGKAVLELHDAGPVIVYIEEGQGRERERRTIDLPTERGATIDVLAGPRQR